MSGFWDDALDIPKSKQQNMGQRVYPESNKPLNGPLQLSQLHTRQHPVASHRAAEHVQHRAAEHAQHRAAEHAQHRAAEHVQHRAAEHAQHRAAEHAQHRAAEHAQHRAAEHVQHRAAEHVQHPNVLHQQHAHNPSLKSVNPHRYLNHRIKSKGSANTRGVNNTCMYVPGEGNMEGSIQCHADFGKSAQELNDRRS